MRRPIPAKVNGGELLIRPGLCQTRASFHLVSAAVTTIKQAIGQWLGNLTRRLRHHFYLYLAVALTLLLLLDTGVFKLGMQLSQKTFDLLVAHRLHVPAADPEIIIVDVNEASLAALAGEYGHWPWPRQVFGEFLENIEAQRPKAVVFDILFSDADTDNPDSDAYFNDTIGNTSNTYVPFLRLPPEQDGLSEVKPDMISGLQEVTPGAGAKDATLAVVLPHFDAAVASGRLGTHNIYPDRDGIVRQYRLYNDDAGWRLPSLPMTLAKSLGYPLPESQTMLLNWRGKSFAYRYVSFSDVLADMNARQHKRPQNEFTDKIVIIGSTAPSLFDLKATPMATAFPGVEILATAIDNIKHGDPLRAWQGTLPELLLSLAMIWLMALAFYVGLDRYRLGMTLLMGAIGLLAVSYAAINLSNLYLALGGPIAWALLCFCLAKTYALAADRVLHRWLAFGLTTDKAGTRVLLMPIRIECDTPLNEAQRRKLKRQLELHSKTPNAVDVIKGMQSGVFGLFAEMAVVSWSYAETRAEYASQAREDAARLIACLPAILQTIGLRGDTPVRHVQHEGMFTAGRPIASQWRALFGQALVQLEHAEAVTPDPASDHLPA